MVKEQERKRENSQIKQLQDTKFAKGKVKDTLKPGDNSEKKITDSNGKQNKTNFFLTFLFCYKSL